MYKLSEYIAKTDVINDNYRLVFASRTGGYIKLKDEVYDHLVNGEFEKISDETLTILMNREILVPAYENEFEKILDYNVAAGKNKRAVGFTIQPTSNCQLGCHYCGQVHSDNKMDEETIKLVIDRITSKAKAKKAKSLSIQWYGGEPLLAANQIMNMSQQLIDFCKEQQIHYYAKMITNGLALKSKLVTKLIDKYKISHYQITIDGLPEVHNNRRMTKKGGHTFNAITKNICDVVKSKEYLDNGCTMTLRVNIDKTNADHVTDLIDYFADLGLNHESINIDFSGIVNWGDLDYGTQDGLDKDDFAERQIDWMLYAGEKGFKFLSGLPSRSFAPCMVTNKDAEVFDAFGNIYPCYEFPYTPKYENAEHQIGHLKTIDTKINNNALTRNWFEDLKKPNNFGCPTCNLFPVCGGGCPKDWYKGDRGCPDYKFNFEDRLALDYLIKTGKLNYEKQEVTA